MANKRKKTSASAAKNRVDRSPSYDSEYEPDLSDLSDSNYNVPITTKRNKRRIVISDTECDDEIIHTSQNKRARRIGKSNSKNRATTVTSRSDGQSLGECIASRINFNQIIETLSSNVSDSSTVNQPIRNITNNNDTEFTQNETSRPGIIIDMLSSLVEGLKSFEKKFDNTFEEFGTMIDVRITVLQKQITRVETTLKHRRRLMENEGKQEAEANDNEYSNDLKAIGLPIEEAAGLTQLNEKLIDTSFEKIMVILILIF